MDLQKFKETYKQVITESTNDSELKNYIRSIVEEVIKEMNGDGIDDYEFYGIDKEKHEKMYSMPKTSRKVFNLGLKPSDKTLQTIIDRHAKTGFILKGGTDDDSYTGIEVLYQDGTKLYSINGVEFYDGQIDSSEEIATTQNVNKIIDIIKKQYNNWVKFL